MGLLRQTLTIFGQDAVVTGITFFSSIILARWLGPVQLGTFYVINLIPTYAEKFGRLGLSDHAAIYYLGRGKYKLGEMSYHLTLIALINAAVAIAFFAFGMDYFRQWFIKIDSVPHWYIVVAIATIPFMFLLLTYNKLLLSQGKVGGYNKIQLTRSVLALGLIAMFWLLNWDLSGALIAALVSLILATTWAGLDVYRTDPPKPKLNAGLVKEVMGYGWKIHVSSMVIFLHQRFDLLVVARYLDPTDVTFYSLAVGLGQLLWKFSDSLVMVLFPEVSKRGQTEGDELTAKACRNTLFVLILASVAMSIAIYPAVRLAYGTRYLPLIMPFFILLPGSIMMALCRVLFAHFYGQGRPRAILISTIPCTLINIVLNLILGPKYGIGMVALISTITFFSMPGKS